MFSIIPYRANRNVAPRGFFDEFANDFFRPFLEGSLARPERAMKVDVRDDGDRYTLEADMPGVARDDVKVEVSGDVLTISANYDQQKEDRPPYNSAAALFLLLKLCVCFRCRGRPHFLHILFHVHFFHDFRHRKLSLSIGPVIASCTIILLFQRG